MVQNRKTKFYSIGNRFSYALIGVVTLVLLGFAALVLFVNISRMEGELNTRLNNPLKIAESSLVEPIWNVDHETVHSFIEALFLDEFIAFVRIAEGEVEIARQTRPQFAQRDFAFFAQ